MSPIEDDAQRIAERGRDALAARLRPAFQEAAKVHADARELGETELERMVQRAADAADGLQWRRALASVAMEELGLGLGEALGHPAVARAHQIIGAPPYEEAVARLGLAPRPSGNSDEEELEEVREDLETTPDVEEAPADVEGVEEASADVEGVEAPADGDGVEEAPSDAEGVEEAADVEGLEEAADVEGVEEAPADAEESTAEGMAGQARAPIQLVCTHIGGIADLASPEPGVELWFSEYGLDIIRPSKEPLGRLGWDELRVIELVDARGRLPLRRSPRSYLVIRGAQGDASFEVHGSPAVLERQLAACVRGKVRIV